MGRAKSMPPEGMDAELRARSVIRIQGKASWVRLSQPHVGPQASPFPFLAFGLPVCVIKGFDKGLSTILGFDDTLLPPNSLLPCSPGRLGAAANNRGSQEAERSLHRRERTRTEGQVVRAAGWVGGEEKWGWGNARAQLQSWQGHIHTHTHTHRPSREAQGGGGIEAPSPRLKLWPCSWDNLLPIPGRRHHLHCSHGAWLGCCVLASAVCLLGTLR